VVGAGGCRVLRVRCRVRVGLGGWLALDAVLNSLFRPGVGYGDAVFGPIKALVPVPVIAGAAMLTFARIIRAGQAMDEEIRATV